MKNNKIYLVALVLLLSVLTGRAQVNPTSALVGSWSGQLNVGPMSLTLVLHLKQADGYVVATLDSPDQGAKGLSAEKEYLSDDSVAIKLDFIGMTYSARLKEGKLDGTFKQNGVEIPLVLAPGVAERKRPQCPEEPFPYETEEVMFPNVTDFATLAGTLTWPVGYDKKQKPKVLLATPPCIFRPWVVATITTSRGCRPALRHLMSKNFSAPRSAPKPASVTT